MNADFIFFVSFPDHTHDESCAPNGVCPSCGCPLDPQYYCINVDCFHYSDPVTIIASQFKE